MAYPIANTQILVTGGPGSIGSAVVGALLAAGAAVRVFTRPESDLSNLEGLPVEVRSGDLQDSAAIRAALKGCTALFHLAADYRLWVPDPERMYQVNVEGTRLLMRGCLDEGIERIGYTSSVAVLGLHDDGTAADETTAAGLDDMIGPYKRSKFLAEAEVRRLVVEAGLPAGIVNPSTPVGPRDIKPPPTRRMIGEAPSGHRPAYL